MLIGLIAEAPAQPENVHEALNHLLHVRTCLGVLVSAQAVAAAFQDMGMPLDDDCNICKRDDPF